MFDFVLNHALAASSGATFLLGLAASQLPKLIGKYFAKELSLIDDIQDPDLRAWVVNGLILIDKKFPVGGSDLAVHALIKAIPQLTPFQGSLEHFALDLQQTLKADIDAQVKKEAQANPTAPKA